MKYDLSWVKKRYEQGERLKFLFFWGHQPSKNGQINKSCLSQWWQCEFEVDGLLFRSAEHWMMAEKARLFGDEEHFEKILRAVSPAEAKKLGRTVRGFQAEVWDEQKYDIVRTGNLHKFEQNELLKTFLLTAKSRILVEASPYDKIWGIGLHEQDQGVENPYNWDGQNLLGFALMEVREDLLSGITE